MRFLVGMVVAFMLGLGFPSAQGAEDAAIRKQLDMYTAAANRGDAKTVAAFHDMGVKPILS